MAVITPAEGDGSIEAVGTAIPPGPADAAFFDVAALGITTGKLADLAVTAGKLAADAVETAKIKDLNVTAGKLADAAVSLAKMADLAQDQFIGRVTASTGVPETATITAAARSVLDDVTVAAMVDTLGGAAATGTGGLVRATSPTLVTPALGTPSALVGTNITGTAAGLTAGNVSDNTISEAKLQAAAVSLAKMADLAQDRFIIRTTASTGVPETAVCTAAARTVLDDATVAAMVDTLGGGAATGTGVLVRATSPTIVTPTIADLQNMTHSHQNAAGGGTLDAAAIAGGTMATARLGSGTASATTFLSGDQSYKETTCRAISIDDPAQTLTASVITTTETVWGATVTIVANTLIGGVKYRLTLFLSATTSASAPTWRIRLRKDDAAGTILYDTGAQAVGNSFTGQPGLMIFEFLGTAAAGASVPIHTHHLGRSNHNFEGNSSAVAQPVSEATNADLVIAPTLQFSAGTAGNSGTLDGITLEKIAP
jgi:hypothetical protein